MGGGARRSLKWVVSVGAFVKEFFWKGEGRGGVIYIAISTRPDLKS